MAGEAREIADMKSCKRYGMEYGNGNRQNVEMVAQDDLTDGMVRANIGTVKNGNVQQHSILCADPGA